MQSCRSAMHCARIPGRCSGDGCYRSCRSVQFLVVDAGIKGCHEANGAWIYRPYIGGRGCAIAQKRLRSIVEHFEAIAEGEDILLYLARVAIEHQDVVTRNTGVTGQAARAIEEGAHEYLRTLIPTRNGILMCHCKR